MKERYGLVTGLSDYTLGSTTAVTSVALGACIIEKHFTLKRNGGVPDDSFSLEPEDLKALCTQTKTAWSALGKIKAERSESEKGNAQFRRSLYVCMEIKCGEPITADNIRSVRPGFGVAPKYFDAFLGKMARKDLLACIPLSWGAVE